MIMTNFLNSLKVRVGAFSVYLQPWPPSVPWVQAIVLQGNPILAVEKSCPSVPEPLQIGTEKTFGTMYE